MDAAHPARRVLVPGGEAVKLLAAFVLVAAVLVATFGEELPEPLASRLGALASGGWAAYTDLLSWSWLLVPVVLVLLAVPTRKR